MTVCSNHPGTPAGLAVSQLLADAEALIAALREVEQTWCAEGHIQRQDWLLLRAALGNDGVISSGERTALLAESGRLQAHEQGYQLTAESRTLLTELDRRRFDWVDRVGESEDAAVLRATTTQLRRLFKQIQALQD